ncbi:helix-turn-helix domain-containing protein [Halostagnicola sp. A56]|uniref:helix-turn-helix domain-containing protein n=1 Tax=Halostagnicola sp. A56 TaxID=1495067 RepID=UPI0012E293BB
MDDTDTPKRTVKTAETLFEIIEYLYDKEEASVTDISNEFGFARSTSHDYLVTLDKMGFSVPRSKF